MDPPSIDHTIRIIEVERAKMLGHPKVAARCACGWQGGVQGGRRGFEYANADGGAHVRNVTE
jgi:hypothetical protein